MPNWTYEDKNGTRLTFESDLQPSPDIVPTLCDIMNIDLGWTHGQSLLPILRGQSDQGHHRDFVRCEFYNVLDMNWNKLMDPPPPIYATMYRNKQYKLSVCHGNDYGELYTLENDPNEAR